MVQARQRSDFVLIEKGIHLFRVEDFAVEMVENPEEGRNHKNYVVKTRVVGGSQDGVPMQGRFPRLSKDNFGLANLLQLLEVCGAVKPGSDIPEEDFDTTGFQGKMSQKLIGCHFGADVVHNKGKQKREDGSYTVFANWGKMMTAKEYAEITKIETPKASASKEEKKKTATSSWD